MNSETLNFDTANGATTAYVGQTGEHGRRSAGDSDS